MGENGIPMEYQNGGSNSRYENGEMLNGVTNGDHKHHSSKHKHKDKNHDKERRKETEEERRIRKEKEREDREKRYQKEGKRMETEEERKIRKEKERLEREERHKKEGRRVETEEERAIRKEKERREKEEKYRNEGRRQETEEERAARKEKERREREERHTKEGRREETEEERRIRKEKERRDRDEKNRSRGKEQQNRSHKETEEERKLRKERERRERKEREAAQQRADIKEENTEIKTEPEDSQDNDTAGSAYEEDTYMQTEVKEEQDSEDEDLKVKNSFSKRNKRKYETETEQDESISASTVEEKNKKVKYETMAYDNEGSELQNGLIKEEAEIKPEDTKQVKAKVTKQKPRQSLKNEVKQEAEMILTQPSKDKAGSKKENKVIKKEETVNGTGDVKKEKKVKEEEVVWKWWEQEITNDGPRWKFLEHKGPLFPPEYEPLPSHVRFFYDNKPITLSLETEEVACFYGKMLDHEYTTKEVFNTNFWHDWRKVMTKEEREVIRDLSKCNFSEINSHFKTLSEKRKERSKEEKKAEKNKSEAIVKEYGFCNLDGYQQRIGNFRVEPPGLFRGRGEHPKQGRHKHRLQPEDITINCSADSVIPSPPEGHKWKEVVHKKDVTWLAMWVENIQNQIKYIMLNPTSKFKGQNDMKKYEKARQLKLHVDKIRINYKEDLKSREMRVRQRAVAMYFIDTLALRAGNEKDEDSADTVGCCSLRVEHIKLHKELEGKENVVEFDFLGKDSVRYYNTKDVPKRVFKNLQIFMDNKKGSDDLFDRLNTSTLNEHLNSLMPGLTAKVFRTYNASITLQEQLEVLTKEEDIVIAKILAYNRANRAVAILCNHQRAVPKSHEKSMETLKQKIDLKKEAIVKAEEEYAEVKKQKKGKKDNAEVEKKQKTVARLKEQLNKFETQEVDKDENKTIALGTSKLNYLDPRISVAWCMKFGVPIDKIYSKTQRDKFQWAIDMTTADFVF